MVLSRRRHGSGFPGGSDGKESAYNAGDRGSILGWGRSPGEGNSNPLQYFGHLMQRAYSFEKTLILGKIEGRRKRGCQEDEMVRWHHQLNEYEFG